jgi:hypothetical protein
MMDGLQDVILKTDFTNRRKYLSNYTLTSIDPLESTVISNGGGNQIGYRYENIFRKS